MGEFQSQARRSLQQCTLEVGFYAGYEAEKESGYDEGEKEPSAAGRAPCDACGCLFANSSRELVSMPRVLVLHV